MSNFQRFTAPSYLKEEGMNYILATSLELVKHLENKGGYNDDHCRKASATATYFNWVREKEPYYRIFPGVLESLLKLDVNKLLKLELPTLPFGLNTLEIEIPECCWETLKFKSLIFENITHTIQKEDPNMKLGLELWSMMVQDTDDGLHPLVLEKNLLEEQMLDDATEFELNFLRILCGILSIGDNPDIVKPMVLRKDMRKYETATDEEKAKLIAKAKRRGVVGYAIGEDIPTKAQIKRMIEENELAVQQGRKATHYRSSHLAMIGTGKNRAFPKLIARSGCIVNKDLYKQVPQGFYME